VVEDNALFEAVTFFVFAFKEKSFEFGVIVIVEFVKCLEGKEKDLKNEAKNMGEGSHDWKKKKQLGTN